MFSIIWSIYLTEKGQKAGSSDEREKHGSKSSSMDYSGVMKIPWCRPIIKQGLRHTYETNVSWLEGLTWDHTWAEYA